MEVGQLVANIVTTLDPSGLNSFSAGLARVERQVAQIRGSLNQTGASAVALSRAFTAGGSGQLSGQLDSLGQSAARTRVGLGQLVTFALQVVQALNSERTAAMADALDQTAKAADSAKDGLEELSGTGDKLDQTVAAISGAFASMRASLGKMTEGEPTLNRQAVLLQGASLAGQAFRNTLNEVVGALQRVGNFGVAALNRLAVGIAQGPIGLGASLIFNNVIRPVTALGGALINLLNPINLVNVALGSLGRIVEIALGVALFDAIRTLTQEALKLVNALSPLTTGVFAGQISTQMQALAVAAANAGYSFDEVRGSVNAMRLLGIEAAEALKAITQGLQINLKPTQIQELARAAQDLAVVIGSNSSEAFARLFNAIVTGDTQMLRFAGIMKTTDQLIQDFSRSSGKSVSEIRNNVNLLRQAFTEGIIEEAKRFAGAYEASLDQLGKRLGSFERIFNDLRLGLGRVFEPFLAGAFTIVEETVGTLTSLFTITKNAAIENAAEVLNLQNAFQLTAKDLKTLADSAVKGGDTMEQAMVKVANSTGISIEKLREMAAAGQFTYDNIAKIGRAFEDTDFAANLRGLSYAVGSVLQSLTKSAFSQFFQVNQQELGQWANNMVNNGIQAAANLANGIVEGINTRVIPLFQEMLNQILAVLTGGAFTFFSAGANLINFLISGMQQALAVGLSSIVNTVGSFMRSIVSGFAEGIYFLSDVTNWGTSIPGAAGAGIRSGAGAATGAASDLNRDIMDNLTGGGGGGGGPGAQALRAIESWGEGISRAILESLSIEDFNQLNFLSGVIRSLFGDDLAAVQGAINLVAQALSEMASAGGIAGATMAALQSTLGAAFSDIARYLELVGQMNAGLSRQRQLEEELEEATDAVGEAQRRLRQFDQSTEGIPERYTRGRRRQLEAELDAAQQEAEKRRDALEDQQRANDQIRESLELQRALIQTILQMAEANERAKQAASQGQGVGAPFAGIGGAIPFEEIDFKVKQIGQNFRNALVGAFAPVRQQFEVLANLLFGLLGQDPRYPEAPTPPSTTENQALIDQYYAQADAWQAQVDRIDEAYKKGVTLRETFDKIVNEVLPRMETALNKLVEIMRALVDLAQGFSQGLSGGELRPSRDPKEGETAPSEAAQAGFVAGQGAGRLIDQLRVSLPQVQQFLEDNPLLVKLVLADLGTGGALHDIGIAAGAAILGGVGAFISSTFGSVLTAAITSPAAASSLTAGLATIGPFVAAGLLAAIGAALSVPVIAWAAEQGGKIWEAIGTALGVEIDLPTADQIFENFKTNIAEKGIVAGILAGIGEHFTTVFTELGKLLGPEGVSGLIEGINDLFEDWKDDIYELTMDVVNAVLDPFRELADELVGNSIVPEMIDDIIDLFTGMPARLLTPVANIASSILGPFQNLASQVLGVFGGIGTTIQNAVSGAQNQAGRRSGGSAPNPVEGMDAEIEDTLSRSADNVQGSTIASDVEARVTTPVRDQFADMSNEVGNETVPNMTRAVTREVNDLPGRIQSGLRSVLRMFRETFEGVGESAETNLEKMADAVVQGVKKAAAEPPKLSTAITTMVNAIVTQLDRMTRSVNAAVSNATTQIGTLTGYIFKIITAINTAFSRLSGPALAVATNVTVGITKSFSTLYNNLVGNSIVPDIVNGIVNEFDSLDKRIKGPVENFAASVENGIASMDTNMNLGEVGQEASGSRRGESRRGRVEINVNQVGWSFPANLSDAQRKELRNLARHEAYRGVELAVKRVMGEA